MEPTVMEQTVHGMANSLADLKTEDHEATPRTAPSGELRKVLANPGNTPPIRCWPLSPQYSISPPASPVRDAVIPWPTLDGEAITYIRPSQEFIQRRPSTRSSMQHPGRRVSISSSRHTRSSSTASAASYVAGASPYPAPSKPLPPVPPSARSSQRVSYQPSSSDKSSSLDMDRFSLSSGTTSSDPSRSSFQSFRIRPPIPPRPSEATKPGQQRKPSSVEIVYWKQLWAAEKRKNSTIFFLDMSTPSSTIATKHGNSIVKFWSVATGTVKSTVKFSSYTEARCRSRDYLIRSHAILSETAQLAAIATRFGRSIEIWNWEKPKRLQLIDDADRWVAGRFESYDTGWSPLAAYRGKEALIDLYAATTRDKKPFVKVRTIDLQKAGLPFLPQYPELALSPTSPLLVAAAGPRTPRAGHPPPDRETLLVAWDISDYREPSSQPHRVVRPWQHRELETALPCSLVAYGDLVISLWIPASYRTVIKPAPQGGTDYKLAPVTVPFRYVLVWDLAENSTRTYGIPNTTSCISPDCRYVAYCHVAERRSKMAVLDAQTGEELWTAGGEGNLQSLQQVGDLAKVTELAFSADGRFLIVGDSQGSTSIYDVREALR